MKSFYQIITTKRCNGVRKDAFITELLFHFIPFLPFLLFYFIPFLPFLLFHFIPFLLSLRVNKKVQPINVTPDQINAFPSSSEKSTLLECKGSLHENKLLKVLLMVHFFLEFNPAVVIRKLAHELNYLH